MSYNRRNCTNYIAHCCVPTKRWYQTPTPATEWLTSGNANTDPNTNFIGTSDNTNVTIGVNNLDGPHITITTEGQIQTLSMPGNNLLIGNIASTSEYNNNIKISLDPDPSTQNCIIGLDAFANNSIGLGNCAFGNGTLYNNNLGVYNNAFGYQSLQANTEGSSNAGFGTQSLQSNTIGQSNCAFGYGTLNFNTEGRFNCAMGSEALYYNVTGTHNTAIGAGALHSSINSYNIALGNSAGYNCGSGTGNIYIYDSGDSNDSGVIKIGENGTHIASTYIQGIYNADVSGARVPVYVDTDGHLGTNTVSSRKYKQDIQDIGDISHKINDLRPVMYRYKAHPETLHYGLIAEEVAEVYPELIAILNKSGEPLCVNYDSIHILMLNELQQVIKHNTLLQKQVTELQEQIVQLQECQKILMQKFNM